MPLGPEPYEYIYICIAQKPGLYGRLIADSTETMGVLLEDSIEAKILHRRPCIRAF